MDGSGLGGAGSASRSRRPAHHAGALKCHRGSSSTDAHRGPAEGAQQSGYAIEEGQLYYSIRFRTGGTTSFR